MAVLFADIYEFPIKYPPALGTLEDLADLIKVIYQYHNRVVPESLQERCDDDPIGLFVQLMQNRGISINEGYYKKLIKDLRPIIKKLKKKYARLRPSQTAKEYGLDFIADFLDTAQTPSYPSGHTIEAYTVALLLADQHPEYTKELLGVAHLISQSRIDRGVHFHSDIAFGIEIAKIMAKSILQEKHNNQILFNSGL